MAKFKSNEHFFSTNDIRQKIDNSVIRYDGKAYYAKNSGDSGEISIYRIQENPKDPLVIQYDDVKFDFSSPPLGFINTTPRSCNFLSRIPARRFTSGLSANTIEVTSLNGQKTPLPFVYPWSNAFRKTIENEYDSALSILTIFNKVKHTWSQAFARNLAFGFSNENGLRLFHKHTTIAFYDTANKQFKSTKSENFLIDSILHNHGLKSYVA